MCATPSRRLRQVPHARDRWGRTRRGALYRQRRGYGRSPAPGTVELRVDPGQNRRECRVACKLPAEALEVGGDLAPPLHLRRVGGRVEAGEISHDPEVPWVRVV